MRLGTVAVALLTVAGAWQFGQGMYIQVKAVVAQRLIAASWAATAGKGREQRPWPWADFAPAARLRVPGHGIDQMVLSDGSARSLAFGPGLLVGSDPADGVTAMAAHRDTHFAFLRRLRRGDRIELQGRDGHWRRFHVDDIGLVDAQAGALTVGCTRECIALVTCDARRRDGNGEPLRLVVTALAETHGGGQTGSD